MMEMRHVNSRKRVSISQLWGRWYQGRCQCHWGLWAADWECLLTSSYDENWSPAGWTTPSEPPPDWPGNTGQVKEELISIRHTQLRHRKKVTSYHPNVLTSNHLNVLTSNHPNVLPSHHPNVLPSFPPAPCFFMCTHSFVCKLLVQLFVASVLVLHLLTLVVIVDGELLQCLQHLFHLLLGRVTVPLHPWQLFL